MFDRLMNDMYKLDIQDITKNENINRLFNKVPKSSIYAYKKTITFLANKEYNKSNDLLPNNFFQTIEESLKKNSYLRTYKLYEKEFNKIEEFFNIEKIQIVDILKNLLNNTNSEIRYQAVEDIKDLIRKYNSKYKGHFLKLYTIKKMEEIKNKSSRKSRKELSTKDIEIEFSFDDFMRHLIENDIETFNDILAKMEDASNVLIDDIRDDVFAALNDNADINTFLNLFGIYKPYNYNPHYSKQKKMINRLKRNFEPLFNKTNYSDNYKQLLAEYINKKINDEDISDIKIHLSLTDKINIEVCYHDLKKLGGKAEVKDSYLTFSTPIEINKMTVKKYKLYEEELQKVKSFINFCRKYYEKEKALLIETKYTKSVIDSNKTNSFDDNNYEVKSDQFININKIKELINSINIDKVNDLSESEIISLNKLLNDDGLLFTYLMGNITLDEIKLIIDNYSSILFYLKKDKLNIDDLEESLRVAKTFTFVTDLDIALIGYDNLVKIINYNQFAGVDVTDEIIKLRIKKARYLEIKSELINYSSLPFEITVKKDGLTLERCLNNDPDTLVGGIETKTCFFISVNENDFFFYSLLNKNGFIIKIVDENNNFIARAACFRRNNALLINGIRLKNNEITPKNKEQKDLMKKVVNLIEMMSEKLIYATTGDECPIDYVLCNKAGILEYEEFDNKYEMIDFKLIREPINIYEEDWKEFININKDDENLLQEVPHAPNTSFTTDFGDNYPLIMIRSRNNMGLLKPSDISLKDQESIYKRPKITTEVYTTDEINNEILAKINRIRALYTFIGSEERKRPLRENFKLIKNSDNISKVVVAEDWIGILYKDGQREFCYTNYANIDIVELQKFYTFKDIIDKEIDKDFPEPKKYSLKHKKYLN